MKTIRPTILAFLAIVSALGAGCSARRADPATLPPDDLYARASAEYEDREFVQAALLFETFIQYHLGDPRAPEAMYLLARSYEARREYLSAATFFARLATDFPTSPRSLDARYATCEAYVKLSPRAPLDQQYTDAALAHCESVAVNFPGTPQSTAAGAHVAGMRQRLADKIYQTGLFYQKRRALESAVIYFSDVLESYPDTPVAPEALSKLIDTYATLGYVEEALEARTKLRTDYPESAPAQGLAPETATTPQ